MRTFVRAISEIISGTRVRMRVTEYTWLNSWLIIRSGIRMFGFTQRRVVSRLPWAPIPASCYCHGIFLSFFLLFFPHSFIRSFVRSFVCLFVSFFPSFFAGKRDYFRVCARFDTFDPTGHRVSNCLEICGYSVSSFCKTRRKKRAGTMDTAIYV